MDHAVDLEALGVVAVCAVLWGLFSARLERWDITGPIAFLAFGFVAENGPIALVNVHASSETVRLTAEFTLALVLFSDASRVSMSALRREAMIPARLLLIGLPLTVGAGVVAALVVFAGIDPWLAACIAAIVAPTDAALGAPIMENTHIPASVRDYINVESGLNDGIATPIVTFFIAGAATEANAAGAESVGHALLALAAGTAIGVLFGFVGGRLLDLTTRKGWASRTFRPLIVLALALGSYAIAIDHGWNGFVAAFVAGLAFGGATSNRDDDAIELTADLGAAGALVVWFIFGALLLNTLEHTGWNAVVYALLSLTLVRMVPVAISLAGSGLDRATVGIVGWFGPRGLASIVFGLIAFDTLPSHDAQTVLGAVTVVVLFSVVAHGASARPLAQWYARHVKTLPTDRHEHEPIREPRTRRSARGPGVS
jgi:NhaP-type Na+/H+ or K+/H+ antiporter